eukprot:TRINITY_DN13188_c0_g6_i1.p1 TRINITY_DN13188_c0_g6~~TRINITY_DN13188_c0_g6_i1.p1  ORF type:complete len:219 (+),score=39.91 TRINITY_DN13188_c0_g6_i1:81-737(+)
MADGEPQSSGSVSLSANAPQMTSVAGPASGQAASALQEALPRQFQEQVAQDMASTVARGAGRAIRQTASEVILYIESQPSSVTAMSFIGGAVLAVVSFIHLLNFFAFIAGPLAYTLNAYELLFGVTICIMDGPAERFPALRRKVVSYAAFLHTSASRSFFYMFIACLEGKQDWFRQLVAWYFAGIAVANMVLAWKRRSRSSPQGELDEELSAPSAPAV